MSRTPRHGLRALFAFVFVFSASACDETRDPPPRPNPDLQVECVPEGMDAGPRPDGGASLSCSAGEVCIQGRCYAPCASDAQCGPRETCGAGGVCVGAGGPRPDSGRPDRDSGPDEEDAGPVDPCDGVSCDAPLVCHPVSRTCTACSVRSLGAARGEPGFCEGDPVCDIANGVCVPARPAACRPCNLPSDCAATADAGPGTFTGDCVTRDVFELTESVCLTPCTGDDTCGAGMVCDGGHCVPAAGISCTTWLRGVAGASCFGDGDCNPLGDTGAVVPGACEGAFVPPDAGPPADAGPPTDGATPGTDAGPPVVGTCRQPCGTAADCATSGYVCNGSFFCVPAVDGGA